ncbi:MAG: FtsW/RodA/SpoVE family cell cycle protein [Candidatus Cloacimonetes bacterium]|nr:FtsW/RodA/SpoVE family cell cycle protein [Candidatus Cloacimonadota bacterium]MCF7814122.1 FtsW/RodA/SpoVE family cell cycle protein [Candidatus Cloacimonadota bacterium]MCF7868729.1 FtsW/RodA/SpoVE family cell cycle protein [Candidatus Cloacimonadota bacterium]MCF7884121.1 FtsW/RodA/SpoVE family cell cycle protein [Candidatus Cloacimonadota bacterium]
MKEKTYIAQYDHYILFIYFILIFIGLYMQLNISSVRTSMFFFYRQFMWFIISGGAVYYTFKVVDISKLRRYSFFLILFTVLLLIAVLIFGKSVKGAVRSIQIWKFNFQPSLIARIVLILYFSHFLDKKQRLIPDSKPSQFIKNFSALIIMTAIIYSLILAERHFSPLVISGFTLLSILFLAKIRFLTIFLIIAIFLVGGIIVLKSGPVYRSERMQIFHKYSLYSEEDPEDKYEGTNDYQIREGLISLSSGKLFGTGATRGTGKHYFLPEAKTDFIFAIIGEERGFFGAVIVILLYVWLFIRCVISSWQKDSLFLKLFGVGLGMNIFFNAMVNIGVSMAALPSTGVTLPFISYGGTSLLVNSLTIGLLLNISSEKKRYFLNA